MSDFHVVREINKIGRVTWQFKLSMNMTVRDIIPGTKQTPQNSTFLQSFWEQLAISYYELIKET